MNSDTKVLIPVIQKVDSAIHGINYYAVDNAIGFLTTYLLNSDLSGGECYPTFEQPGLWSMAEIREQDWGETKMKMSKSPFRAKWLNSFCQRL